MTSFSRVQWVIAGVSLLTAYLVYYVSQFDTTPIPEKHKELIISERNSSKNSQDTGVIDHSHEIIPRVISNEKIGNLFIVDRPPVIKPRKEKLVAPPLPYAYMGKMTDKSGLVIFLTRNEKVYVVRSAGQIDPEYRVELINPPFMEFTYLPLKEKQLLNIGVNK